MSPKTPKSFPKFCDTLKRLHWLNQACNKVVKSPLLPNKTLNGVLMIIFMWSIRKSIHQSTILWLGVKLPIPCWCRLHGWWFLPVLLHELLLHDWNQDGISYISLLKGLPTKCFYLLWPHLFALFCYWCAFFENISCLFLFRKAQKTFYYNASD